LHVCGIIPLKNSTVPPLCYCDTMDGSEVGVNYIDIEAEILHYYVAVGFKI